MVYFISDETSKYVKIGYTADLLKRLSGLQTGHAEKLIVLKIIDGGHDMERYLHNKFVHLRKHGEWFLHSDELRVYINSLENIQILKQKQMAESKHTDKLDAGMLDWFSSHIIDLLEYKQKFIIIKKNGECFTIRKKHLIDRVQKHRRKKGLFHWR